MEGLFDANTRRFVPTRKWLHPTWRNWLSAFAVAGVDNHAHAPSAGDPCPAPPMLTLQAVRLLALALPEVTERSALGTRSFEVRGRVFARLHSAERRAALRLCPEARAVLARAQPRVFKRASGARRGWTSVELRRVDAWLFEELLLGAWRDLAPKAAIARWIATRPR